MEDPHEATRQTINHKSDIDRIFDDQCLFVSPLYAVAEEQLLQQAGVGGGGTGVYEELPENSIVIHTMEHVDAALEELRPSFVVVVSPDVAVTRLLEVCMCVVRVVDVLKCCRVSVVEDVHMCAATRRLSPVSLDPFICAAHFMRTCVT